MFPGRGSGLSGPMGGQSQPFQVYGRQKGQVCLWIYSRLEANTDLCDFWLQNFCRLLLTGKYVAVGDNIRNKSECVTPGIELGICGFTVDWKPILTYAAFGCKTSAGRF